VIAALVFIQRWRHASEIEPLLAAIEFSQVCSLNQTGTCSLHLSNVDSERFDLHPAENPLLGVVHAQLLNRSKTLTAEVLRGAHVLVEDEDSKIYDFLRTLPGAWRQISSHQSDRDQYGIPEGRVVSTLLVGRIRNTTWFQLEDAPWDPFHDFVGSLNHAIDYVEYKIRGRNIGPLGTSEFTDKNPLGTFKVESLGEVCPTQCANDASYAARLRKRSPSSLSQVLLKAGFLQA
jgi:hypothetical protein